MFTAPPRPRDRIVPATGALAVTALVGALLFESGAVRSAAVVEAMKVFDVAPPPSPPPAPLHPSIRAARRKQGAAAPPNLRNRATEVVAPVPPMPLPVVPPIIAAPIPATGAAANSGSTPVAGPGTGAGGNGTGFGSGDGGDGDGGGGDDGGTPPILRRGRLKYSDYPRAAGAAGIGGTVGVRYLVGVDGRVGECDVTRSSGSAELDEVTCRLIRERFRFAPSRDGRGRPVPAWLIENHSWIVHDDPPEPR